MARLIYIEVTDPNHILDEHDELTSVGNIALSPSIEPSDWLGCIPVPELERSGQKLSSMHILFRCRRPANCESNRRIMKRRRKNELHMIVNSIGETLLNGKAEPAVSDDNFVAMPAELTAENGAKALLVGEFSVTAEVLNSDYCGCGLCDSCENAEEPETLVREVQIPWTTIKAIYKKAVEALGRPLPPAETVK